MNYLKQVKEIVKSLEEKRDELRTIVREKEETRVRLSSPFVILSENQPISQKMRACFYLRTKNDDYSALVLAKVAAKKGESVLLRHEAAYCLGQMKNNIVFDQLLSVLQDKEDDSIVRHECAEALGAIGNKSCIQVLSSIVDDKNEPIEVRETCELALDRFKDLETQKDFDDGFNTVDPAIPVSSLKTVSVSELEINLNSETNSLYERYRAMFTLRNRAANSINEKEQVDSVIALSKSLLNEKQGSLFRHEVAFVLGQLCHEASVPYLEKALEDETLHEMVRHESAEALGGVGNERALEILKKYVQREKEALIVRESCEVALDAAEYWNDFENKSNIL